MNSAIPLAAAKIDSFLLLPKFSRLFFYHFHKKSTKILLNNNLQSELFFSKKE